MKLTMTEDEAKGIIQRIKDSKQIVPAWFWTLTPAEVAGAFNGVGSELTWKPIRKALSFIFRWAKRAVVIHDCVFQFKKRFNLTMQDFKDANRNLKINARIELRELKLSWYNPLRWYRHANAWRAKFFCNLFGKGAWAA